MGLKTSLSAVSRKLEGVQISDIKTPTANRRVTAEEERLFTSNSDVVAAAAAPAANDDADEGR